MIEKWRGEGGEEKGGIVRIILFLWMDGLGSRIGLEKERKRERLYNCCERSVW